MFWGTRSDSGALRALLLVQNLHKTYRGEGDCEEARGFVQRPEIACLLVLAKGRGGLWRKPPPTQQQELRINGINDAFNVDACHIGGAASQVDGH